MADEEINSGKEKINFRNKIFEPHNPPEFSERLRDKVNLCAKYFRILLM
jgi:hypothetical protein